MSFCPGAGSGGMMCVCVFVWRGVSGAYAIGITTKWIRGDCQGVNLMKARLIE